MNLIQNAYIVSGLPHILLAPDKNPGWKSLHDNYRKIGEEIERSGAELILVYSTQWFSVIGHLFQVDPMKIHETKVLLTIVDGQPLYDPLGLQR